VLFGENFSHLLEILPNLYLLAVDPYRPYDEQGMTQQFLDSAQNEMARNLQKHYGRVFWQNLPSIYASWVVLPKSLDFVFIDAAHDEDSVRADVAAWSTKIKPGGWLIGHDASWPGVAPIVKELGASLYDDDVWAVQV
jgi:predicted O-methyltransferase YrrM